VRRERRCRRDGNGVCSCEMGNLYRYAEPAVLLSIARTGRMHGYSIAQEAAAMSVTHAGLDTGIVYRTLHSLEMAKMVVSEWECNDGRHARKVYRLTPDGKKHLAEWTEVIDHTVSCLSSLSAACHVIIDGREIDS